MSKKINILLALLKPSVLKYHFKKSSSIPYSQLEQEDSSRQRRDSESSVQFIPESGIKRALLVSALIVGTTISIFYMRHFTAYSFSEYFKDRGLESETPSSSSANLLEDGNIPHEDHFREIAFKNESSKPTWSWVCEEAGEHKRCVRFLTSQTAEKQSLKTCNMICTETPVWPQPTGPSSFSDTVLPVEMHSFSLNIVKSPSKEINKYLEEAFAFMIKDIHEVAPMKHSKEAMTMHHNENARGLDVRVTVDGDSDPRLRLDTKENYNLEMKPEGKMLVVNITAQSFCGARHGFETLSQLVWYDHYLESVVALEEASVEDVPKFRYRGLLLDTARQYFPVEDILRTIDAMSASKLNTFHWHATDSQSFPLKLNSFPQMALYGAYSLKQVYTPDDIRTIVQRARVRGIRVVIEIDAPAHVGRAWNWGPYSGLGNLTFCVEHDPWNNPKLCGEPPCGQLNPLNDHVHEILEKIYTEIIELTGTDDVFHLGGDEVNRACWEQNIRGSFIMDVWYTFAQKSLLALQNANKGTLPDMTIIWSSKLTEGSFLNHMKNYTIQVWGASEWSNMKEIPQVGLRTIISHVNAWYLDCGFGQWFENGGACQPYRQWQEVYNHRPWEHQNWKVEGGTACMWSEQLAPEGVDSRVWPRGAAVAERLWSDPPKKATKEDYVRLDMHRHRLIERRIQAEAIWSRWCTENPYECT